MNEIGFSEPYIPKEQDKPIDITVNFESYNGCSINVNSSSIDKWYNTLNINFEESIEKGKIISYQCGKNHIFGKGDIISCNFELNKLYILPPGDYELKNYESLGKDNTFKLNLFEGKYITFFGLNEIQIIGHHHQYVSEVGSKIVFSIIKKGIDEILPIILLNNSLSYLTDCHYIESNEYPSIAYCNIQAHELMFIEKEHQMWYLNLCNKRIYSDLYVDRLDKNKYHIFRIKQFILPDNSSNITSDTEFIIRARVEGNINDYNTNEGIFQVFIDIENNYTNKTYNSTCSIEIQEIVKDINISCYITADIGEVQFNNLYLLPYYIPLKMVKPYEVIIKKVFKAGDMPEPEPSPEPEPDYKSSLYFKVRLFLYSFYIIYLFVII